MNRKWIALLLSCALVLTLAAACGRNKNDAADKNDANNGVTNPNNGSGNVNTPGSMTPGNDVNNGT